MNIVIINGSPRKKGATAYILHEIEKELLKKGVNVDFYNISEQKIQLCNGCCACYRLGHCVIDDDAEKISQLLADADGVVIGSSTIASNVPAALKALIDRGHFVIEQLLHNKYALCVATYENYGGNETAKVLKNLLTLSGSYLCGKIVEKIPFNSDYISNLQLNKRAQKHALKLYNQIANKKQHPLQKLKQRIVIKVGLKPFILRKGSDYAGVWKRWSDIGLL